MRRPLSLALVGLLGCGGWTALTSRAARAAEPAAPSVAPRALLSQPGLALLRLRREPARALYLAGQELYWRGEHAAALQRFEQARRIEPIPDLLFEIAACHARLGRMPQAFRYYRRYVRSFREPAARLAAAASFGRVMEQIRQARAAAAGSAAR